MDFIGGVLGGYGHVRVFGEKGDEFVFDPWFEDLVLLGNVFVLRFFVGKGEFWEKDSIWAESIWGVLVFVHA